LNGNSSHGSNPTTLSSRGIEPDSLPGPGLSAQEIMEAIHRGEIKALFSMCFNPLVSLPDATFTREALSRLEF
jgi:assimilatory nitrate reductase catalytic subunit